MRKAMDAERDDLAEWTFEKIGDIDAALRTDLHRVLAGDKTARLSGAVAILVGIALSGAGAILGALS